MSRSVRQSAIAVAAVLVAAMALPTGVSASPDQGPTVLDQSSTRVTLITGDVVELMQVNDERHAVAIEPGSGREDITFHMTEDDDRLVVLPADVIPYVSTGLVDETLFDINELIDQEYDDASAPTLPLIVRYDTADSTAPDFVDSGADVTALPSIDGSAFATDKGDLTALWEALTTETIDGEDPSLAGGVAEVWLDARVRPVLDRSTAQIGAGEAWDVGLDGAGVSVAVLDTGIDLRHPDLVDRIAATHNFSDSLAVTDIYGHGTHVASIIAGTGNASGGVRNGVSPGADLMIGKVLNDEGSGQASWIISGMEWAVAEGAQVVNMSLGGSPSDGSDPMSQAVDQLSAKGTLFVVAAGNFGWEYGVASPGSATAALTVGAVDRDEGLASFSSRGPRLGDNAPKPEITAPGVGIVAARGAGTSMGTPVDRDYTAASGTSMAAPHVAGAATLLSQQNPDWDGARLKDALINTALPNPQLGIFEQGAGRVDVAQAVGQATTATSVVDFGFNEQSDEAVPTTERITYVNPSDEPVVLELELDVENIDRSAPANEGVRLSASEVTVPAGSAAEVEIQFDVTKLDRGRHAGRVIAAGSDGSTHATVVAATVTGQRHTVTLNVVGPDGEPGFAALIGMKGEDRRNDVQVYGTKVVVEVEEGPYLVHAEVPDHSPSRPQMTVITDPTLEVTEDTEVTLDVRTAVPVRVETPKPAEQRSIFSYHVHRTMANGRSVSYSGMQFSGVRQLNVTPTAPITAGTYEFSSRWQLRAPLVTAAVSGVDGPFWMSLLQKSPVYEGKRSFRIVYAGGGTPEELEAAGVAGALAVMDGSNDRYEVDQVADAAAAGAAAALIVRGPLNPPWTHWAPFEDTYAIPGLVVGHDDGRRIIERAKQGQARLQLTLTPSSPYLYDVLHVEKDYVPDEVVHRVTPANSARATVGYSHTGGYDWAKEQRFGWRPWQEYSFADTQRAVRLGTEREEWISSAGDSLWQQRAQHWFYPDDDIPLLGGMAEAPRSYEPGQSDDVVWYGPVVRPAIPTGVPGIVTSRINNILSFRVPEFVDSAAGHYSFATSDDNVSARLFRDGELVATLPDAWRDVETTDDPATYRLELATERDSSEWQWVTRTETAWQFRSERPADGESQLLPLLQVDYDVPVDVDGQVHGRAAHAVGLTVRHQDGLTVPDDTDVRVDVSFDEGETWSEATVAEVRGGYRVTIPSGEGTVSLRVRATAADGSAIDQTIVRAYGLR